MFCLEGLKLPKEILFSQVVRYFIVYLGDELQLEISKAGSASHFEKNSPPEVLRVIEGANHH